jgi:hypothetical protein
LAAQHLLHIFADTVHTDHQVGAAISMDKGKGQRHRGVGNVAAADVEGPGDRIGLGQHVCVGLALFDRPAAMAAILFSTLSPANCSGWATTGADGGAG